MSTSSLSLFPARAAIGIVDASGRVYMTPEFSRAMGDVLARLGGANGMSAEDVAVELATATASASLQAAAVRTEELQLEVAQLQAAMARVAALRKQVEELEQQLGADTALLAQLATLGRRVDDLETADALDTPQGVDWAHPGKIGATTPNSASFTTVGVSGQVTSTVATGTAPFVVASRTQIANLNPELLQGADWGSPKAIGNFTPAAGTFTNLKANNGFGCNGKAVQGSVTMPAAATDLATAITLVNTIRTALIANGIGA
jgi:hypothetical protein